MNNPARPTVECDQFHPGLAVPDLQAAIDFYVNKLGFTLGFTWGEPATFAGINLGNVQVFLSPGAAAPADHPAAVSGLSAGLSSAVAGLTMWASCYSASPPPETGR